MSPTVNLILMLLTTNFFSPCMASMLAFPGEGRDLRTAKYRVNYQGRFQLVLGDACSGPLPEFRAECNGGDLTIIGTSSPKIQCTVEQGGKSARCTTTCTDRPDCDDVLFSDEAWGTGAFGEIFFQCDAFGDANEAGATLHGVGKPGYQCENAVFSDSRIFNVVQLGVYQTGINDFSFRSNLFECHIRNRFDNIDGKYSCYDGFNCDGSACQRESPDVYVDSDPHNFPADAIQSLDGSEVLQVSSDSIAERPPGTYSVRFQTNWQLLLGFSCTGIYPTIFVECTNGEISSFTTLHDSTNCTITSPSTGQCTDNDDNTFVGKYNGFAYTCTSQDKIPTAKSTYPSYNTKCTTPTENDHLLQMGVSCGEKLKGDDFWWYHDFGFECVSSSGYDVADDGRFFCLSRAESPGAIPELVMGTDPLRWPNIDGSNCFNYIGIPGETGEKIPVQRSPSLSGTSGALFSNLDIWGVISTALLLMWQA